MSMKEYLEIFTRHVEKLAEIDHYGDDGYTREFQTLKQRSAEYKINGTYSTEEGEKEWNKRKNRFKDILPYDYTRVKLIAVPGVSGSDYINANFLKGPNGQHMYIASQGPLLHTKVDFWRMVWEYDVHVVVMACNEYEGEKLKCARYWPSVGKSEKYGKITVRFEREEKENQNFCIRHLVAEYGSVTRNVWQFHYGGWPDHGTPDIPSVLEMISVMRERQGTPLPPIVVHCSAGCGRTGTICAIDYAWHVLKLGLLSAEFSLFNIIDEMRTQRNAIVQTKDQYVSVHHAVRDLFTRHMQVINEHNYENLAVNGQVPPSGQEYDSVPFDGSQYLEPSKTKPTTLTAPNQESPTERAIYSTVANLINANQIGTGNGGAPPSPPEPIPDPDYVSITMKDYKAYASDDEVLQSKTDSAEEEQHSPPVLPHYATSHRPTNRNLEGNTLEAPAPPPRSSSIRRTVSDEPIANHLKPDANNLELGDSSNSQESGGTPGTNKETLGLLTDYMGQNSDGWSSSAAGSQEGGEVLCDDKPDLLPDLPPPPPRPACMVKPTDRSSNTNSQNVNHYYNIADLQTNQQVHSSLDDVASSSPTDGSSTDLLLEPPPLPPKLSDNESDEPDGYQMNTVIRGGAAKPYPSAPPKPPHSSDAGRCKSSPIHVSSPVHSSSSVHTSSPGLSSSPLHSYDLPPEHRQSPVAPNYNQHEDPRNSPHHAHNQKWMQEAQMIQKQERDNRASPMYEVLSKFRSGPSVDHPPRQMNRSMEDADDESEEECPQVPVRLYKTMPHPGKQQRRRRQQQLQLLLQQQQQEQAYAQRQESPYHMGSDDKSSPGVVMIRNPAFSASMTQAELSPKLSPSKASEHVMHPLQNQLNDINKPGLPQKMHGSQDARFQTYVKHEGPIEKRMSNIQLDDPIYGFHGQPQQQQQQYQQQQQPKNNVSYAEGHYKVPSNHHPRDYKRQYSGSPTRNEMSQDPNLCQHHKSQQQQQQVQPGDLSRLPSTGDPDMEFAYNKDDGDYVSLRVKQQQQQQLLQRQQQQIAFQQNLDKQQQQREQQLQQQLQQQQQQAAGGSAPESEGAYGYAYVGGGGKPSVVVPQGPAPIKPPRRKRRPHSVSAADMSERMERDALRHRASARMEESCEGALGIPDAYQPVEGATGANSRMTRSSYGSTSEDSLQGPDIPYKTPEAYFPAHQAGMDDHQIASQDETSVPDSMTSSVIQFGKKIKRAVMGQGGLMSTSNHSDVKPVSAKDIYFKGKLINFPHRVDRPRRPASSESPYEVPRSTQVHRK